MANPYADNMGADMLKNKADSGTVQQPCSAAYLEGRKAYSRQIKVGNNPHDENSSDYWEWMRGWAEAGIESRRHLLPNVGSDASASSPIASTGLVGDQP